MCRLWGLPTCAEIPSVPPVKPRLRLPFGKTLLVERCLLSSISTQWGKREQPFYKLSDFSFLLLLLFKLIYWKASALGVTDNYHLQYIKKLRYHQAIFFLFFSLHFQKRKVERAVF